MTTTSDEVLIAPPEPQGVWVTVEKLAGVLPGSLSMLLRGLTYQYSPRGELQPTNLLHLCMLPEEAEIVRKRVRSHKHPYRLVEDTP